jgi:hypothetical protein
MDITCTAHMGCLTSTCRCKWVWLAGWLAGSVSLPPSLPLLCTASLFDSMCFGASPPLLPPLPPLPAVTSSSH